MANAKTRIALSPQSNKEPQAAAYHRNYNVFYILSVTTLRTIDLEGKKNSNPLFSRFYAGMSVFFEGNPAPECVHDNQNLGRRPRRDFGPVQRTSG
jgi:hypothetical protein